MFVNLKGEFRGLRVKDFGRKDGTTGKDCRVLLEVDCESILLPCDESVMRDYDSGKFTKGDMVLCTADYRPTWKYNQFVVKGVQVAK